MSCKLIRFTGATSTNEVGTPAYGITGVRVNRDENGELLDSPVVYWSDGTVTDLAYNVVAPLSDIADFAAAKAAEAGDCSSDIIQYVTGEDSEGKEVVIKLINGLYDSAIYLSDGSAYTGPAVDLNWDDETSKDFEQIPVCFNGQNLIALVEFNDYAQRDDNDTAYLTDNAAVVNYITPTGAFATTTPTQADFDSGVAKVGECRVSVLPPSFNLCGGC